MIEENPSPILRNTQQVLASMLPEGRTALRKKIGGPEYAVLERYFF